jgi:hypothetical protein
VYVGAVVIIATMVALDTAARAARRATGIAPRTARRWIRWWRGPFILSPVFVEIAGRVIGIDRRRLPSAIVETIPGTPLVRLLRLLGWVAPLTTESVVDGARFVGALVEPSAPPVVAQKMASPWIPATA